jgi:hypothetical protein
MNRKQTSSFAIAGFLFAASIMYFLDYRLNFSTQPTQSFKIAIRPTAATLFMGRTRNITVTIVSEEDFDFAVKLSLHDLPPGISVITEPDLVVLPAKGLVTYTLTIIGTNASVNSNTLTIEAMSNGTTQSAHLAVKVVDLLNVTKIAHWSYDGFGSFTAQEMVQKTLELGAEMAVISLKDSYGNVYFGDFWNSNNETKIDISLLVEQFHTQGIPVIGDVAGLNDPHWVATHRDSGLFIWNQTTGNYTRSEAWIEPYYVYADIKGGQGYTQYIESIINATLQLGLDGINFDDQLIYPYTEYTKPNCTFSGSSEFKKWANITQSYSGHERYFAQRNETDSRFFSKRAEVIDGITEKWTNYTKQVKPDAITTVYLNPKDHIAHGVRLSSYSQFFDALYVQAYSNYVDYKSLSEIRANVSKPLYAFVYSLIGVSYPPVFFNDENVIREIAQNARQLEYEGIGVFTANKAFEDKLEGLFKELFEDYAS